MHCITCASLVLRCPHETCYFRFHYLLLTLPVCFSDMKKLENYVTGHWVTGDGDGQLLSDAVTGETIAAASTKGLDFASILDYGRTKGNIALRKLTFHERGRMLKALALFLMERKEKFYQVSYHTGATRADSWIDIEGG